MLKPIGKTSKATLVIAAFLVSSGQLFGQEPDIMGEVLDVATGLPIPNAVIQLPESGFRTVTDQLGYFEIPTLPSPDLAVTVSGLGYDTLRGRVSLAPGDRLEIELTPAPVTLLGIDVIGAATPRGEIIDPGLPSDFVASEAIRDMEYRVVELVEVLRELGGPRLHLQQRTGRTGLLEYCVQSTRALGTSRSSCKPALISVDGVITFWPGTHLPNSGLEPAELIATDVLRMRPEDIQDVLFLSPTQAYHRFGEAGRYGALMIRTREGGDAQ